MMKMREGVRTFMHADYAVHKVIGAVKEFSREKLLPLGEW